MIHEDNQRTAENQRFSLGNVYMGTKVVETDEEEKLFIKHLKLIYATPRTIGEATAQVFLPLVRFEHIYDILILVLEMLESLER